jgi:hypothetical protein
MPAQDFKLTYDDNSLLSSLFQVCFRLLTYQSDDF